MKGPKYEGPELTPHQEEALDILEEESAELIKCCSKIRRAGMTYLASSNNGKSYLEALIEEIRDVFYLIDELQKSGLVSKEELYDSGAVSKKAARLRKWTNHLGRTK
jgi:hypothetical protein